MKHSTNFCLVPGLYGFNNQDGLMIDLMVQLREELLQQEKRFGAPQGMKN